ncbi:MAG: GPR endopeptidase [Clostridiales bacterium]|nr:GPR endopeptidase [Clostridiales bacterium]
MFNKRTDLAVEAWQIAGEQAQEKGKLSGVDTREYTEGGATITVVDILDERGEQAVGKPRGRYVTLEFDPNHISDQFTSIVETAAKELKGLMPEHVDPDTASVLVIGLGNWHITPDAIGPRTIENIMVTRHLVEQVPEYFSSYRPVSALAPGVLGITGMESLDIIRGVCSNVKPDFIIAVDALVSRSVSRLCRTIQFSNTGISPGSGIGNTRASIGRDTLGIPVIAAGIPTVVDAATLAYDMVEQSGGSPDAALLEKMSGTLHVSPKDVDKKVQDIAKLLGYAINMALHDFSVEDITSFLS